MPYPILTKIEGMPSYEDVKIINNELTGNAVTITTNLGGGRHGYISLTLTAAIYANIYTHAWIPLANPGVQAVIPAASTGQQISALNCTHEKQAKDYEDYVAFRNALKKQLIVALEYM